MPSISCNDARLYYEDEGSGQPIVCLHGVMGGLRYFHPQLSGLSDAYRPIALDYRGHGRSEKTPDAHRIPQYARDLEAFLTQLDLEDVVLVGWSMGSLIAWDYITQFGPDRIQGVVDIDMEPTRYQWPDYDHGIADLASLQAEINAIQTDHLHAIDTMIETLVKHPPSPEQYQLMFDELAYCPPTIKTAILFDCTFQDYRDILPDIEVPHLVCAGGDERWRSIAAVEHTADLLPNAAFDVFDDSSHCISIEQPPAFNTRVHEFITNL